MDELDTPTKFDLQYTESKIIFSICDCSLGKILFLWFKPRGRHKISQATSTYRETYMGTIYEFASKERGNDRKIR